MRVLVLFLLLAGCKKQSQPTNRFPGVQELADGTCVQWVDGYRDKYPIRIDCPCGFKSMTELCP